MVADDVRTWVVGGGGQLGSSVRATLTGSDGLWRQPEQMRWLSPQADTQMSALTERFLAEAGARRWRIVWCAGAGVTGAAPEDLRRERAMLSSSLDAVGRSRLGERGSFFLASSAGGVYAGGEAPPFDERSATAPISAYGEAKVELEELLHDTGRRLGMNTLVGRISNLYGPAQDLTKPQGLIPQLIRALLLRRPLSIYVPTDTLRDHLYAADCGRLIDRSLARLDLEATQAGYPAHVTKVLASQQAVTIGFLVAELHRIARTRPLVVYGRSANARFQAVDLRMRSVVWPEVDQIPLTPLAVGMRATMDALTGRMQGGALA